MSRVVEETVAALVEFESGLDKIKSEEGEAKKRTIKEATELAAIAKANALSKARQISARRLDEARKSAEAEAESIRKKGDTEMNSFEAAIAKRKREAAELVTRMLLGEA